MYASQVLTVLAAAILSVWLVGVLLAFVMYASQVLIVAVGRPLANQAGLVLLVPTATPTMFVLLVVVPIANQAGLVLLVPTATLIMFVILIPLLIVLALDGGLVWQLVSQAVVIHPMLKPPELDLQILHAIASVVYHGQPAVNHVIQPEYVVVETILIATPPVAALPHPGLLVYNGAE
jgi:hypothetical protein